MSAMPQRLRLSDFAIILHERDNVATALRDVPAGTYDSPAGPLTLAEPVRAGFKLALRGLAAGEKVYKYGHVIGVATRAVAAGQCVHVHNIRSSVQ